jgi:hypothetical protein
MVYMCLLSEEVNVSLNNFQLPDSTNLLEVEIIFHSIALSPVLNFSVVIFFLVISILTGTRGVRGVALFNIPPV